MSRPSSAVSDHVCANEMNILAVMISPLSHLKHLSSQCFSTGLSFSSPGCLPLSAHHSNSSQDTPCLHKATLPHCDIFEVLKSNCRLSASLRVLHLGPLLTCYNCIIKNISLTLFLKMKGLGKVRVTLVSSRVALIPSNTWGLQEQITILAQGFSYEKCKQLAIMR